MFTQRVSKVFGFAMTNVQDSYTATLSGYLAYEEALICKII
jgi:hypothetical protein